MAHPSGIAGSSDHRRSSMSTMSIVSARPTSLEVCEFVYGEGMASVDTISRFYECNANNPSYENPFLTATSRSVIADIHQVSRQLSSIDIPRPLAVLCTLFRLKVPTSLQDAGPLFRGLRVWTEMGDVCESESFDGHRKAIVEHTLNLLLLPGIHYSNQVSQHSTDSLISTLSSSVSQVYQSYPSLRVPGTALSVPSPFHLQLHIVTRLSFNEQGRVTHHRDFWDVKDVLGLVPGVSLAQWIGTRLAALGLSYISKLWTKEHSRIFGQQAISTSDAAEKGETPAAAYVTATRDKLGLENV